MSDTLYTEALKDRDWIISHRRAIHEHPELAYHEFETAARVRHVLDELHISYREAGTGTIADIESNGDRSLIALRADMDALPIREETSLPFASKKEGVMHACGHDAHTAMLLGTAKLLAAHRAQLPGPVRLIFQPAQEGHGGANAMIAAGALRGVQAIYCLHAGPGHACGQLVTRPGVIHAASDGLHITVKGLSAHGSAPHEGVDAIVIASHIVLALQDIITREIPAREQAVLTVGSIHGGTARNIVCDSVTMDVTLRTLDEDIRSQILNRIPQVCSGIAQAMRGSAEVEHVQAYCVNRNDPALTRKAMATANVLFGEEGVKLLDHPSMEGEDFGFYLQQVKGVKLYIGTGREEKLHTTRFELNEELLPRGAAFLAALTLEK